MCQTLRHFDHWRRRSTHTTCVSTSAARPKWAASGVQRVLPEAVLLAVAAERQADLVDRVAGAHQHLRLGHRLAVELARAERDPARKHVALGVISVNDSSSAKSTITPVESFIRPGRVMLSSATSPGSMPVSGE